MYISVSKYKMILVETLPGIGRGGVKESSGGVNSSMIYLTFVNASLYPYQVQQ
jgi:hypothetical protein